jgi:TIR domain
MNPDIFISYRRADVIGHAGHIHEVLAKHFGRNRVFRDIAIPSGVNFRRDIESALEHCSVVVAVIGKGWLCKRLFDPDDMLRHELEVAVERGIVIPVLVDEAPLPRARDLPSGLRGLIEIQALWIHNDSYRHGLQVLISRVREMVAPRPPSVLRSLLSPVGWALAVLTGLANVVLQVGGLKAAGAGAIVLAAWVTGDQLFARRRSLRPA